MKSYVEVILCVWRSLKDLRVLSFKHIKDLIIYIVINVNPVRNFTLNSNMISPFGEKQVIFK